MTTAFKVIDTVVSKDLINHTLKFMLPLNYADPNGDTITVVANLTQNYAASSSKEFEIKDDHNIVVFLQGGPGFPCTVPTSKTGYTKELLDRGYQVLFLDQRGTGFSTPLEVDTITKYAGEEPEDQLKFILNFRADSIVLDCESIRQILLKDKVNRKWSLLGQSYGGFCSITYLSFFPTHLKQVLITGGIPPINLSPDDVYTATYKRTIERNVHYYKKYPGDVENVKAILEYLSENKVILPNGGHLTVERFQQLGLGFGSSGGTDKIHNIVFKLHFDIKNLGKPTYQILNVIQHEQSFDTNIIYALFQEAIYCEGSVSSNWSANRLRLCPGNENFYLQLASISDDPVYFTGEMVYKSMFNDYSELRKLKPLAKLLHSHKDWSPLYNTEELAKITNIDTGSDDKYFVKVVAASYYHDQYVDFDLSMKSKNYIGGIRQYITSEFFHDGLRAEPKKVLGNLFSILDQDVD